MAGVVEKIVEINFLQTDAPTAEQIGALDAGLSDFNANTLKSPAEQFAVFIDREGKTAGGILGTVRPRVFLIKKLWMDESIRGQGYGQKLVSMCEDKATSEGCEAVIVDTMSYQAPEFYKKLGYTEIAVVKNYYGGHNRIFFEKLLKS